MLAAMQ